METDAGVGGASSGAIAGADGCRGGWVVATRSGAVVVPRLSLAGVRTLGVDMPIGLPVDRPRACDHQARRFLGPRASTVFPTPPRATIGAADHAEASRRARAATGAAISIQAFHLLAKIAEVDALVDPRDGDRVVEIHPECAFVVMNDGAPLAPKRTADGAARTPRALLDERFERIDPTPRGAAADDVLDAYAVLWSAERFAAGTAIVFGDGGVDGRGLPMRIVA